MESKARAYSRAGIYALLLDPRSPHDPQKGKNADYAAYLKLKSIVNCPIILAGGINAENAAEAIRLTGAQHIDVLRGVESSPGIKDEKRLASLMAELKPPLGAR